MTAGASTLESLHAQGLEAFQSLGFPSKHDEDWRYTSVREFLQQEFHQPGHSQTQHYENMITSKQTDVPWGNKIVLADGKIIGLEHLGKKLPPGVLVMPFNEALERVPEKITPHLNQILKVQHGFHAQNTALMHSGLFIYVPAHICLAEPLLLVHWQTQEKQAQYIRHVIVVEKGATATVIEDYKGPSELSYYTNVITEAWVGANGHLKHYKTQRESKSAWHMGHFVVKQFANSKVESHVMSFGALWSRFDACFILSEPKSECYLNGIYVPGGQQHMDHHTWVYHDAPQGTSQQDYKGVVNGAAHAVFNGQIHVAKHAQKTVAKQQNKNLLLSKQAEIDTKPQLDIAADDVQCTHGATVGQLDAEAIFYFATRGIETEMATHYLIQAFAAENLRAIEHEAFAAWLQERIVGANYE